MVLADDDGVNDSPPVCCCRRQLKASHKTGFISKQAAHMNRGAASAYSMPCDPSGLQPAREGVIYVYSSSSIRDGQMHSIGSICIASIFRIPEEPRELEVIASNSFDSLRRRHIILLVLVEA